MYLFRFFGAWALVLFCFCGACLSGLLAFATYPDALALERIIYHDEGLARLQIIANPASFGLLKAVVFAVSGLSLLVLLLTWKKGTATELRFLFAGLKKGIGQFRQSFRQLPSGQKKTAYGLLAVLLVLRTYFSITDAADVDEIASFHDFVRKDILAVIAYYPVPNNHIFSNLIAFFAYQLVPGFWFAMRLPTLLISMVGSVALFLILLRHSSFTVALLTVGLWGLSGMGLYYGYAGRGYALYAIFAVTGFFCLYGIHHKTDKPRLLWAVFIAASALGFYTIPAFLYSFLSVCAVAFIYWLARARFADIKGLIVAGLTVTLLTLFLYLPVFFVSGPQAITGNSYVVSLTWEKVLLEFYAHTQVIESNLLGIPDRGFTYVIAAIACFLLLAILNGRKGLNLKLGLAACILVLLPFIWVVLQRVQPPSRIFFYKSFFLFLVVGLVLQQVFSLFRSSRKAPATAAVLVLFFYGATQLLATGKRIEQGHQDEKRANATMAFVMAAKPNAILITRPWYSFYFLHYVLPEFPELTIHNQPKPGQMYNSVLIGSQEHLTDFGLDSSAYRLGFSSNRIQVYFPRSE